MPYHALSCLIMPYHALSHSNCHENLGHQMPYIMVGVILLRESQDASVVSGGFPKGLGTLKSHVYING